MTNNDKEYDVFLSHSNVDSKIVIDLAKRLEDEAKLKVWLDRWVLIPGEHWQQAMARGLDQAKSCAICIGEQTPSGWFKEEIERSLNRQTKDKTFRVIPTLLPNAKKINLDDFLELRTWVEFKKEIYDDHPSFHILVCGIRGIAPGRFKIDDKPNKIHTEVKTRLVQLKEFRDNRLIDDEIAKEAQRRLIDKLIKF